MWRSALALAAVASAMIPSSALAQGAPPPPTGQFVPPGGPVDPSQPYGQPVQGGGLNAPPPFTHSSDDSSTTSYDSSLEAAKQKDSGRGLTWFWLEADGGFEQVGLHTFKTDEQKLTAGLADIDTTQNGGIAGGGIGARLFVFTIGARARMGIFKSWQLGRIGGELGLHLPFGVFEPHFDIGGGYAFLGHFAATVPSQISIHGGYARVNAGLDLYPVSQLSFGFATSFDFMALTRSAFQPADIATLQSQNVITAAQGALLADKGTAYGATFAVTGVIGLHL
jgi:hypothetical protein